MTRPNQAPQPTEPGHRNQPRRRRLSRIAGVLAAAVVISWGGPAANAFWQTLGSNAGSARADSIPAVAAPSAAVSGGAASVTWKQGTTAEGRPVAGYTVARYSAATGGTNVAAGGGCAGTITALNCSEASLPAGTWYYTVTPVLGLWAGAESVRSGGVAAADTTPPVAPTITAPALINSAPATPNTANVASVPVTFSAEQGSSVRVTATDTPPSGGTAQSVFQVLTATGSNQTVNFNLSGLRDGTITYSAVATDAAGNPSTAGTTTSAKDATAPTATVTLFNSGSNAGGFAEQGDIVSIKYSGDINSNSICNAWTNGQQPPEINANNAVTVNIDSNLLTVSSTGAAGCAINIGQVSLGGNYGSLTFKGNSNSGPSKIAWNNATQTLTITLGSRTGTPNTVSVGTTSPTVAPPAGVTDVNGNQAVSAPASPSRF